MLRATTPSTTVKEPLVKYRIAQLVLVKAALAGTFFFSLPHAVVCQTLSETNKTGIGARSFDALAPFLTNAVTRPFLEQHEATRLNIVSFGAFSSDTKHLCRRLGPKGELSFAPDHAINETATKLPAHSITFDPRVSEEDGLTATYPLSLTTTSIGIAISFRHRFSSPELGYYGICTIPCSSTTRTLTLIGADEETLLAMTGVYREGVRQETLKYGRFGKASFAAAGPFVIGVGRECTLGKKQLLGIEIRGTAPIALGESEQKMLADPREYFVSPAALTCEIRNSGEVFVRGKLTCSLQGNVTYTYKRAIQVNRIVSSYDSDYSELAWGPYRLLALDQTTNNKLIPAANMFHIPVTLAARSRATCGFAIGVEYEVHAQEGLLSGYCGYDLSFEAPEKITTFEWPTSNTAAYATGRYNLATEFLALNGSLAATQVIESDMIRCDAAEYGEQTTVTFSSGLQYRNRLFGAPVSVGTRGMYEYSVSRTTENRFIFGIEISLSV